MSSRADVLSSLAGVLSPAHAEVEERENSAAPVWDADHFAEEQLRALVRQVFLPGWPRPCRQVVFSAVDTGAEIDPVCMKVAVMLSRQAPGNVAVVHVHREPTQFGRTTHQPDIDPGLPGSLRESSHQIAERVWRVSFQDFVGAHGDDVSAAWLRGRLNQVRMEFDYALLQAPSAAASSAAALLGHLSDGVVLVLQAGVTRRMAAERVRQGLVAANARLLGTVLNQRKFPIPARIYRWL